MRRRSKLGFHVLFDGRETADPCRQVACADVILLNKTDLVDSGRLSQVEETIR